LDVYAGRANDKKLKMEHDPAPNIRLDYLDSLGRQMTPKEAFRDLSYHFHGKKPGEYIQSTITFNAAPQLTVFFR
jgi:hypothetical protein